MIITRQKYLDMLVAGQCNGLFDFLLDEQSIERY